MSRKRIRTAQAVLFNFVGKRLSHLEISVTAARLSVDGTKIPILTVGVDVLDDPGEITAIAALYLKRSS